MRVSSRRGHPGPTPPFVPASEDAQPQRQAAVPPTVMPSIFSVGWPTPTGTL